MEDMGSDVGVIRRRQAGDPMESPMSPTNYAVDFTPQAFSKGLATMVALASRSEFDTDLRQVIRRDGAAFNAVHALRRQFFPDEYRITIPNEATPEGIFEGLVNAFSESPLSLERVDVMWAKELIRRDLDAMRGNALEVHLDCYGQETMRGAVQQHQWLAKGTDGNAAAFAMWLAKYKPMGEYITIPYEDAQLIQSSTTPGRLEGLAYQRFDHLGRLVQELLIMGCDKVCGREVVVSFRPVY